MSVLTVNDTDGFLHFDEEECRAAGAARAARYQANHPFPHIAIENLIDPGFLSTLLPGFPSSDSKAFFDRDQERLKFQFQPTEIASRRLRNFLIELNSRAFLAFLEEMTGIEGLIPDPYFVGGGLHEIRRGGHLGVHADFNVHGKLKLERRLNLLIYLNEDWDEGFGGALELWDKEMSRAEVKVYPHIGHAVVFSTNLDSFHGHPDPLACPPDRSRRSIATYYYTAVEGGVSALPQRTTVFRQRPGTADQRDLRISFDHFLKDWVPPRLYRYAAKLNRFK